MLILCLHLYRPTLHRPTVDKRYKNDYICYKNKQTNLFTMSKFQYDVLNKNLPLSLIPKNLSLGLGLLIKTFSIYRPRKQCTIIVVYIRKPNKQHKRKGTRDNQTNRSSHSCKCINVTCVFPSIFITSPATVQETFKAKDRVKVD